MRLSNRALLDVEKQPLTGISPCPDAAFTLLEVMIAVAIFFAAMFAILSMTSQNLRLARSMQIVHVDPASLAAELALTNKLEEGTASGDFGKDYPGVTWLRDISLYSTNGLYLVNFAVIEPNSAKGVAAARLQVLLYRPDSVAGAGGGSTRLTGGTR